jgi:hypothetical protein
MTMTISKTFKFDFIERYGWALSTFHFKVQTHSDESSLFMKTSRMWVGFYCPHLRQNSFHSTCQLGNVLLGVEGDGEEAPSPVLPRTSAQALGWRSGLLPALRGEKRSWRKGTLSLRNKMNRTSSGSTPALVFLAGILCLLFSYFQSLNVNFKMK